MNCLTLFARCFVVSLVFLASLPSTTWGAETSPPVLPPSKVEETNSQDMLRSFLQIQEQLHAARLAIERNREEANAAAARNAETFAVRLQTIDQSLASQRARELEVLQSSNRVMLLVAGSFAAIGFLAMLLMAWFQWRTVGRLAEVSASLPAAHALGFGPAIAALGPGEPHLVSVRSAEQSNLRLRGALERLEKRIFELEHAARPTLNERLSAGTEPDVVVPTQPNGEATSPVPEDSAAPTGSARITVLLGKGQSLLNLDQTEAALACFDELLAIDASHPEALVKKGAALERLRKLDEALVCYDRAIAADNSLTIAYLYKGGLCNRMERFDEALQCYEQALRTQEKRRA